MYLQAYVILTVKNSLKNRVYYVGSTPLFGFKPRRVYESKHKQITVIK